MRDRLSPAEAEFLDRQRVAHLATADLAGSPRVVPVCFAVVEGAIYSVLDLKPKQMAPMQLRRVRNIVQNPRVALVADVYDDDWSRLGFVLVTGSASVVEAGPLHDHALAALRARYPQYRAMDLAERPVIAIAIEHVSSWGDLGARAAMLPP